MSELICARCNAQSPEHALYCQQCSQPLVCKHCKALLLPVARACVQCGQLIPERSNDEQFYAGIVSTTPPGYSRLKWHETPDERDLDAMIDNNAIEHIRDLFPLLSSNRPLGRSKNSAGYETQIQTDLVEVSSTEASVEPQLSTAPLPLPAPAEGIWEIFQDREGRFTQERRDLKASNKKTYIIRLAHLYIYARYLRKDEKVPRDDVFRIIDESGYKDTRRSTYILESGIRSSENETFYLTLDGREKAQKYLSEALDSALPAGWPEGVESRSVNNHAKKPAKKISDDPIIAALISHPITKELAGKISHGTVESMTVQDKALFALYCFSKIGTVEDARLSQITTYLSRAFESKVLNTSLPGPLSKAVEHKPAYVMYQKGSGYRITKSGIEHIEQLLGPDH